MFEDVKQDLRYAVRTLRRSPGFTALAVVILGAGIGAATTIFSAVHAVLLSPLPFADADELVMLWERNPDFGWERATSAPANVLDWRERVDGFDDVTMYFDGLRGLAWIDDGEARQVQSISIAGNFFEVLGVRPAEGVFPEWRHTWSDAGRVAVLTHAFWQDELGGDPAAVGRSIELDGEPFEVVGVAPPGFRFPSDDVDLWVSFGFDPASVDQAFFRRAHWVTPIARLAPGTSVEVATEQLDAVALQLQQEHPVLNKNMFAGLTPIRPALVGDLGPPLRILFAAVGVLLLLACVNVGNLLLVRAAARVRELSIRRAIGAGRRRLVHQVMVESVVLGLAGGALGIGLAVAGVRLLAGARAFATSGTSAVALDAPVLVFAVAVSVAGAMLFGLAPALRATRGGLADDLRDGGRSGADRGRRSAVGGLVMLQVALATVLVLAAGLVTRSFERLRSQDPGVEPAGVYTFELTAPSARYPDAEAVLGFWDAVVEAVEALPGVEGAAVTNGVPLTFAGWTSQLVADGWEPGRLVHEVRHREVTPGYFDVLSVPILRGRGFTAADRFDAPPVVVVNQAFAERWFAGEDPIGRRVTFDRIPNEESIWREVVGVVGDERQLDLARPSEPEVLAAFHQDPGRTRKVLFRVAGPTEGVGAAVRAAVREVDPAVPVAAFRSMDEIVAASSARLGLLVALFGVFGVVALLLAAGGVYGVTAQAVRQRVPEFGIRMALGAERRQVVGLVMRRGAALAVAGVAVGALVGLAGGGAIEALLYEVAPGDPTVLTGVAGLLVVVALVASWIPARRAARLDPVASLRAE